MGWLGKKNVEIGRTEVYDYLGVTDAYLVLWKTLRGTGGMDWLIPGTTQLTQ